MNAENVLWVLILAGTGLCLAYFWAEMARRKQDRARADSRQPTPNKRGPCRGLYQPHGGCQKAA